MNLKIDKLLDYQFKNLRGAMIFSIATLSKKCLFATLSKNETQHNDTHRKGFIFKTQHNTKTSVTFYVLVC